METPIQGKVAEAARLFEHRIESTPHLARIFTE
jgi:hypothetical protein